MMRPHRWLILRLEAPLVSFGGVAIDHIGVTRDFPAASMLTGMIANALGWDRMDWRNHQALQDHLVFASRIDREDPASALTDIQNVKLSADDKGWTTGIKPETRGSGEKTCESPYRRKRDYFADAAVTIALRLVAGNLEACDLEPGLSLDSLAAALMRPKRPIFLGRKTCLPAAPVLHRDESAPTAYEALALVPAADGAKGPLRCCWPVGEGPVSGNSVLRIVDIADLRNWRTGLHGGSRRVVEGTLHWIGATA
ncbi:MAG TPA: type I-E CRISPR-associated protein Cas5/CasD [Terracidiphilus sp.]|nr:type I-E CRISPR-associated protein Cas5/CasD [Terracidiphilus sp.]